MATLRFLQQNAEWICAIAVAAFASVQCWISHQQNLQNIRIKRLELANRLDAVAANFLGEVEEARSIRQWLFSNSSNFAFLLNNKDLEKYKKMCGFILNYIEKPALTTEEKLIKIREFLNILSELDAVLINAKYGFVKAGKEFKSKNKGTKKCE